MGLGRALASGAKLSATGARASARMEAYAITRAARPSASTSTVYRQVNALTGGRAGAAVARPSTVTKAGTSRLPALPTVLEGFRPTVVYRETADAIRHLTTSSNWSLSGMRAAAGRGAIGLDPDSAGAIAAARQAAALVRTPESTRLLAQAVAQRGGWFVATGTATGLDWADKAKLFDPLKPATRWAP